MNTIYQEFAWIQAWIEAKFDWASSQFQSASDWISGHPGIMALGALGFLVLLFLICSRVVIMPEHQEESG